MIKYTERWTAATSPFLQQHFLSFHIQTHFCARRCNLEAETFFLSFFLVLRNVALKRHFLSFSVQHYVSLKSFKLSPVLYRPKNAQYSQKKRTHSPFLSRRDLNKTWSRWSWFWSPRSSSFGERFQNAFLLHCKERFKVFGRLTFGDAANILSVSKMGPLIDVEDDYNVFQSLYDDVSTHAPEGRVLYLSRHGESEFNLYGKIGVNSLSQLVPFSSPIRIRCHSDTGDQE